MLPVRHASPHFNFGLFPPPVPVIHRGALFTQALHSIFDPNSSTTSYLSVPYTMQIPAFQRVHIHSYLHSAILPCDMNTVSAPVGRTKCRATLGCNSRASPECWPSVSRVVQAETALQTPIAAPLGSVTCHMPPGVVPHLCTHSAGPTFACIWEKEPATFSPAPCSKCSVYCCMFLSGFCPSVKLPVL